MVQRNGSFSCDTLGRKFDRLGAVEVLAGIASAPWWSASGYKFPGRISLGRPYSTEVVPLWEIIESLGAEIECFDSFSFMEKYILMVMTLSASIPLINIPERELEFEEYIDVMSNHISVLAGLFKGKSVKTAEDEVNPFAPGHDSRDTSSTPTIK